MKRLIALLLSAVMVFAMANIAMAEEAPVADGLKDYQNYLWNLSGDLSDEEFQTLAVRNFKFIQSVEPIVDEDSYKTLYKASVHLKQGAEGSREEFIEAQDNLVMNLSIADGVFFLWDQDNIPAPAEDAALTDEELDAAPLDGVGFVPLLVKCLLDDPTQAKGNIIVISGGAGSNRSNSAEAYPAIPVFQDLGYNVFVLQYRIAPYSRVDMGLDTQRAVRLVRYYAQQEGWGGQDMIAAAGWSAGAGCIMNAVNNFYGDINGSSVDESYVPDEIDLTVNSDMDVAMPIYGGGFNDDCANPNIPAMYLCVGSEDAVVGPEGEQAMYDYAVAHGIPAVLHIMEGAGHGFGVGQEGAQKGTEECALWPGEADQFMMVNKGHSQGVAPTGVYTLEAGVVPVDDASADDDAATAEESAFGDIPADYTQIKVFDGTYGFGDAEITAATNDDQSAFYITFVCFDEDQILEGTIDDGIVNVEYDLTGFVSGDAQLIWDDAVASEQAWVAR